VTAARLCRSMVILNLQGKLRMKWEMKTKQSPWVKERRCRKMKSIMVYNKSSYNMSFVNSWKKISN